MFGKLKSFLKDDSLYFALLLILVALISFLLGRNSAEEVVSTNQPAGVVFHKSTETKEKTAGREVVVSKSGSKYHYLDCPGASIIKEDNKIYFDSEEQAKAAGYSLAANCN